MVFILASGSASRRQILTNAAVPFTAQAADVDEESLKIRLLAKGTAVRDVAVHLAEAKALAVSNLRPEALVLGADQTLVIDEQLVSKCADRAAARALLLRLRGRTHQLAGGMVLARRGNVLWRHVETSTLTMRAFSEAFLDVYLAAEGEALLASVGCYRMEGLGAQLFAAVEGDYFAILGLPLQPLLAELRNQGVLQT
ncbi:MAG TPA: Maf family protein [Rhizomicrobium sp.]|jgi:septum formation protein|nr:Maf family protein [Rhizomicrobium sp.]